VASVSTPSGASQENWRKRFRPGQSRLPHQPWTDCIRAACMTTMIGRPVAMHAMRGISAHSQWLSRPVAALHVLQIAARRDRHHRDRSAHQPPYPKGLTAGESTGQVAQGQWCA
jgi:hypothetical protein